MQRSVILSVCLAWLSGQLVLADDPPKSLDPRLKIELFAEHPQIVTPTGLDVDHRGRVFAIESNTHFPPEGYKGHPTDRVLVMSDTDGDGKADKIVVFKDGLKHSMSVVVRPIWFPENSKSETRNSKEITRNSELGTRNSVYIATRREILQLHDDDGDDKADREERIVHLDTKGDYPHNGLAGFAIDALGWMYFGFGENLGADYKIIGSDGTTLSGGGEGGNIYRCRLDGSKLSHIATGFWNPHASCFDAFGRLFTVDNDADSRPPCRLLHVIPGGDYGYRFRNGRKGLHPFTAWNGEIPGTLPMVAGTGEAPSGILAYESDGLPEEYLGNLLVTSWGDHRIDRFRLQPKGTSFTSLAEPLITGGENFRPVGLATAPDGSLFCTDWVLRDYKLHGHGRIWRITAKDRTTTPTPLPNLKRRTIEGMMTALSDRRLPVRRLAAQSVFLNLDPEQQRQILNDSKASVRAILEARWSGASITSIEDPKNCFPLTDTDPARTWVWLQPSLRSTPQTSKTVIRNQEDFRNDYRQSVEKMLTAALANMPTGLVDPSALPAMLHYCRIQPDSSLIRTALSIDDPFLFSTVVSVAAAQFTQDDFAKYLIPDATPDVKASAPRVRQAMLLAARKQAPREDRLLRVALSDHDPDVRRLAVQWVAEEKLTDLKPLVEAMFGPVREGEAPAEPRTSPKPGSAGASPSRGMTPELFLATIAALEMLDGKKPEDFDKTPAEQYVVPLLKDEKRSPAVRAQALRLVSPTDNSLDAKLFKQLLASEDFTLRLETLRTLQFSPLEEAGEMLASVATSPSPWQGPAVGNDQHEKMEREHNAHRLLISEAILGLASVANRNPPDHTSSKALQSLLKESLEVRMEVIRSLRQVAQRDQATRDAIFESVSRRTGNPLWWRDVDQHLHFTFQAGSEELKFWQGEWAKRPQSIAEWKQVLAQQETNYDKLRTGMGIAAADSGRRVFYHPNGAGCFKCHTVNGRGGKIGPDLSTIARSMSREKLIDSILEPSREIAPQFVSWTFELKDGKVVTGMVVHENEGKTIVGDAEGKLIEIKTIDIETRTPQKISVMPEKLAERMTLQELRDLLAFLDSQR